MIPILVVLGIVAIVEFIIILLVLASRTKAPKAPKTPKKQNKGLRFDVKSNAGVSTIILYKDDIEVARSPQVLCTHVEREKQALLNEYARLKEMGASYQYPIVTDDSE